MNKKIGYIFENFSWLPIIAFLINGVCLNTSYANVGQMVYVDLGISTPNLLQKQIENQTYKDSNGTLHLLAHGEPGKLLINNNWLDKSAIAIWILSNYNNQQINHINIYGCNFAKGEKGKQAVSFLERALGVSIAASDDITGIDGDWDLEVGNSETAIQVPNYTANLQTETQNCPGMTYTVYEYHYADAGNVNSAHFAITGSIAVNAYVDQKTHDDVTLTYSGRDWTPIASGVTFPSSNEIRVKVNRATSSSTAGTDQIIADAMLFVDELGNYYIIDDADVNTSNTNFSNVTTNGSSYSGSHHNVSVGSGSVRNFNWRFFKSNTVLLPDLDGDGVADHCDSDVDNDGILNEDESICNSPVNISPSTLGLAAGTAQTGSKDISSLFGYPAGSFIVRYTNAHVFAGTFHVGKASDTHFEVLSPAGDEFEMVLEHGNVITKKSPTVDYFISNSGMIYNMENQAALSAGFTYTNDVNRHIITRLTTAVTNIGTTDGNPFTFVSDNESSYFNFAAGTSDGGAGKIGISFRVCAPTDTDGDGTPDYKDLDSDNDGCPDALEATASPYDLDDLNPDGSIMSSFTVNSDGVPSGNNYAAGSSKDDTVLTAECDPCNSLSPKFADNDGDGIGNECDLDDDNDGILDDVENNCTPIAISGSDLNLVAGQNNQSGTTDISSKVGLPTGSLVVNYKGVNVVGSGLLHVTKFHDSEFEIIAAPGMEFALTLLHGQVITQKDPTEDYFVIPDANRYTFVNEADLSAGFTNTSTPPGRFGVTRETTATTNIGLTSGSAFTFESTKKSRYYKFAIGTKDSGGGNIGFSFEVCAPTDTDGDGIPNHLDVDSDGDGCPDAIESAGTYTTLDLKADSSLVGTVDTDDTSATYGVPNSQSFGVGVAQDNTKNACINCGTISGMTQQEICDAIDAYPEGDFASDDCDGDGVTNKDECDSDTDLTDPCDFLQSDVSVTPTADTRDTDTDGVLNVCDLDDDNDGILDIEEGSCEGSTTGTWSKISDDVWESPISSDLKVRVSVSDYTTYWDAVAIKNDSDGSCTGATSSTGNVNNKNGLELYLGAQIGSSQPTNPITNLTVEYLDVTNTPVKVLNPTMHILGLGGYSGGINTSSEWKLRHGVDIDLISGANDFTVINNNTIIRNTLGATPAGNNQTCGTGEASGTVQLDGNLSTYSFNIRMLNGSSNVDYVSSGDRFILLFEDCVESRDTDGDGTPDYLDIDSDNDDCNDVVEAGHTDTNDDGEVDGTGIDTDGKVTGASTAYTGNITAVTDDMDTLACKVCNPGNDGTLTICEGESVTASSLFASLGGSPEAGGAWTPALAGAGTYTYTVSDCNGDPTSEVVVSEQSKPDAGSNGTLTICEGETVTASSLFASLGGSPETGGTWTPTLAGAGTYTYTVNATSPCTGNATATVVVTEESTPNAGSNGTLIICTGTTVTASSLFAELGGSPQTGGTWTPTLAGAGTYTYTVNATSPCTGNATATVVVTEESTPNAGSNGTLIICTGTTVTASSLFAELGGSPQTGGTWTPTLAGAGTYTYTVNAASPCTGNATATVVVTEESTPNAGSNGTLIICTGTTVTASSLFTELGGSPQTGGTWTPTLAGAGTYTYTVNATSPCTGNATATVVVTEESTPNAGSNGTLIICTGTTVTASSLFAELGGSPQTGGTWTPTLAGAGTYTYTVNATSPCTGNATATVVVTEQSTPNAGSNGILTICSGTTVTASSLFAELGGSPETGGTWTPTLAGAGTYTYTVNATSPCTVNATSSVVVSSIDNLTIAEICARITSNPMSNFALSDCDGDGIINKKECENGTDPKDPCNTATHDNDMDGVGDICDLDSDNDGILDVEERDSCSMSYNFTGSSIQGSRTRTGGSDLERDFIFGDSVIFNFNLGALSDILIETTVGNYGYAVTGTVEVDGVSQSISTTASTFQSVIHSPSTSSTFSVKAVGTPLNGIVLRDTNGNVLAKIDFEKTGSNVTEPGYTSIAIGQNATSVPPGTISLLCAKARDTDNDGTPDYLDTDSDNDGCSDAVEAGVPGVTSPDSLASSPYGANGLSNSIENNDTYQANTTYTSTYDDLALDDSKNNCTTCTSLEGLTQTEMCALINANPTGDFATSDCDGDGETNKEECDNGTDPTNPCDYTAADQDYTETTQEWKDADCDGDGVTNGKEVDPDGDGTAGPDGTVPTDPCDYTAADQDYADTTQEWKDADCDGDGVTNGKEVDPDGNGIPGPDGTDPTDPCEYDTTNQDYTKTTQEWKDADCDGDGVPNGEEVDPDSDGTAGPDGTNPTDPCEYDPADQDYADTTQEWKDADCDGDGVPNGEEVDPDGNGTAGPDGTDPSDPCEYDPADQDYADTTQEWKDADCDGDGVPNGEEVDPDSDGTAGPGGTNPTDPCEYDSADQDYADTTQEWKDADCDGDGVKNGNEVDPDGNGIPGPDGTSPKDSCEYDATNQDYTKTTQEWKDADCDGDAVTNGKEVDPDGDGTSGPDGTDPKDPCDYNPSDQVGTPTADLSNCSACGDGPKTEAAICAAVAVNPSLGALDCDGDGETNKEECDNGTDPTDPCEGGDLTEVDLSNKISDWYTGDCDGDGVKNGNEVDPDGDGTAGPGGTDLTDPCDYNSADQVYASTTQAWKDADCDGDGITNGKEVDPNSDGTPGPAGTNPTDPCDPGVTSGYDLSNSEWADADCDGDGVTNGKEVDPDGDGTPGGTGPNGPATDVTDPCDYNSADQVYASTTQAWKDADCDGDGITNGKEVDPNSDGTPGPAGTNPTDPCDPGVTSGYDLSNSEWADADCDGDGVTNGKEVDPDGDGTPGGTGPNGPATDLTNPCDYNSADQVYASTTQAWKDADCDGDGITNGKEVDPDSNGTPGPAGTNPTDPCDPGVTSGYDLSNSEWADADCDGDGVTNGKEVDPDGDGTPGGTGPNGPATDPTDPCDYNTDDQVYASTTQVWKDADCDGDGITNGMEVDPNSDGTPGPAGTNPTDPCDPGVTSGYDLSNSEWADADCDGDGVTNGKEVDPDGDGTPGGTGPNGPATDLTNPCDYNSADQVYASTTQAWKDADCDGDGITNGMEVDPNSDGTPGPADTNPTDPCDPGVTSGYDLSNSEWADADCDGDGVTNGKEVDPDGDGTPGGTGPNGPATDAADPCDYNAADQVYASTTQAWKDADCDGDGITNGKEVDPDSNGTPGPAGTNPTDPCDPSVTSGYDLSNSEWADADCDGDGVTNGKEVDPDGDGTPNTDGTETDPTKPCDYNEDDQDYASTTQAWKDADCDGDAVTNGKEVDPDGNGTDESNGTDPIDECSYDPSDQVGTPTADLSNCAACGDGPKTEQAICDSIAVNPSLGALDCDGDGMTNKEECDGGTDPTNPCEGADISEVDLNNKTSDWYTADCDGDAVPNGKEVDPDGDGTAGPNATDPTDPCSHNPADQVGTPTADLSSCPECGDGPKTEQAICDSIAVNPYLGTLDCDGDGMTNKEECDGGTDPTNPCEGADVSEVDLSDKTSDWYNADCDGDAVPNGKEVDPDGDGTAGPDGTDPTDPCSHNPADRTGTPTADLSTCSPCGDASNTETLCEEVEANPFLGTLDCDGDGISNADECDDNTNPEDKCDPLRPVITTVSKLNPLTCSGTDGSIKICGLTKDSTYYVDFLKNAAPGVQMTLVADASGCVTMTGLTAGTYDNFELADGRGCMSDIFTTDQVLFDPSGTTITLGATQNPSACGANNGFIILNGLSPGLQYTLNLTKDGGAQTPTTFTANGGGTHTVSGLEAGSYELHVVNQNCPSNTLIKELVGPNGAIISMTSPKDPTACSNNDGSFVISGLAPGTTYLLTYQKDGNDQTPITFNATSTSYKVQGLTKGEYSFINVTNNDCSSNMVEITLKDPTAALINVIGFNNPSACGEGDGNVTFSGLVSGRTYGILVKKNGLAQPPISHAATGSSYTLSLLGTGEYEIYVADGDCESNIITQEINDPGASTIIVSSKDDPTSCGASDGLIQISGLTPNTTYTLNYVKDEVQQTGISINPGSGVTYNFSGLTNGIYTGISVTAGGCTSNVVSETLVNPSAATIVAKGFNPKTCNGSDGKILITGLSQGLNYTLTYKKDGVAQGSTPISATSTSYMLTGLTAADYTEIIINQNVCESNSVMVELTEICDVCDPNETPADLNNSAWAAADCDGDGVTNEKEVDPDGDGTIDGNGTNPQNGCDYNSSDQDYSSTTQEFKDDDCDGDGVTNGEEIDPDGNGTPGGTGPNGELPTDPQELCDYNASDQVYSNTTQEYKDADCDGDGVTNAKEIDPDGNGTPGGTGPNGEQPTDPQKECDYNVSDQAYTSTTQEWKDADCDGDGVTNGEELDPDGNGTLGGTNGSGEGPTSPNNECDYNSSDQDYTTTTQAWKDLDCDGDGVTNGKEVDPDDDGNAGGTNNLGEGPTNPEDSCDYNSSDKTLPRTSDEPCCVVIETGVWLEGALFNDNNGSYLSTMKTDLWNQGVLPGQNNVKTLGADTPVGQPYNDSPWAYNGSEGTPFNYSTVGDNKAGYSANTVDWVLVSLRTANDIDSTVCTRAALLMKDGSIVFVGDDCCDVDVTKSYYLVIEHRNHLIVMSPTPIAVSADNKISFDFRTNQSFKPGFNDNGQKQLSDGRFVMYAGNGDQTAGSGSFADINSQDNAKWSQQNNSSDGYFYGDHTLSGDVNAQDNSIWDDNNNVTSGVDR